MQTEAERSISEQQSIEQADTQDFDQFLQQYFYVP